MLTQHFSATVKPELTVPNVSTEQTHASAPVAAPALAAAYVLAQRRVVPEFSGAAYLAHFEELIAATLQASAGSVATNV